MEKIRFSFLILIGMTFSLTSCSVNKYLSYNKNMRKSGTIIISNQVPTKTELASNNPTNKDGRTFAPLIGYFPTTLSYLPADNETWLEIDSSKSKLTLYKGKTVVKDMAFEGASSLPTGDYFLQRKQKDPIWYAPDNYFTSRQLKTPSEDDKLRFRKGALGKFALFPTTSFPIHCGAVWSQDVGGLKLNSTDLSSIYYMIQVGDPVIVK